MRLRFIDVIASVIRVVKIGKFLTRLYKVRRVDTTALVVETCIVEIPRYGRSDGGLRSLFCLEAMPRARNVY